MCDVAGCPLWVKSCLLSKMNIKCRVLWRGAAILLSVIWLYMPWTVMGEKEIFLCGENRFRALSQRGNLWEKKSELFFLSENNVLHLTHECGERERKSACKVLIFHGNFSAYNNWKTCSFFERRKPWECRGRPMKHYKKHWKLN